MEIIGILFPSIKVEQMLIHEFTVWEKEITGFKLKIKPMDHNSGTLDC